MPLSEKTFECPGEEHRIDRVVQSLTGLSRRQVQGLFDHDCVSLNEQVCRAPAERLQQGDQVLVRYDAQRRYHPRPPAASSPAFRIVFEDDHLIVVDKSPGWLTVPTENREDDTLISRIGHYLSKGGRKRKACVVHRLDRGASGLLVFGKAPEIAERLRKQFEERKPERLYAAIVAGRVDPPEGIFESFLATAPNLNRYSTPRPEEGQLAITHYKVERFLDDATLVRVQLETGRRNQIRVHFAEAGHPVLGDSRYEAERAAHPFWPHQRLALHAAELGFMHPRTGRRCRFSAPLPREFLKFLRRSQAGHSPEA